MIMFTIMNLTHLLHLLLLTNLARFRQQAATQTQDNIVHQYTENQLYIVTLGSDN